MELWGIKSCDTCRKALKALEGAGRDVTFRDIRAEPLDADQRSRVLAAFGEGALNTRSTTWRGLSEAERGQAPDALLEGHPTLMKRPVIVEGDRLYQGWGPDVRAALGLG